MSRFPDGPYLVTGASGGIGAATVRRLVSEGATVVASGRDEAKLAELAQETGCEVLPFDLTSEESIKAAVSGRDWYGVVNCGGDGGEIATPMDTDISVFDRVIAINARGALLVIKYATPGMIEAGRGGSIVNVSSQASLVGLKGHISYGSSKAALDNITRVSALELGQYGIRVNSISPGFVKTALTYYVETSPDWDTKMKYYGGMPRLALPQELGGAYTYLLSDTATYTTGIDIPIAGVVGAW